MTDREADEKKKAGGWQPSETPRVMTRPMIVGWVVALVATGLALYQKRMGASPFLVGVNFAVASAAFLGVIVLWTRNQRKQ